MRLDQPALGTVVGSIAFFALGCQRATPIVAEGVPKVDNLILVDLKTGKTFDSNRLKAIPSPAQLKIIESLRSQTSGKGWCLLFQRTENPRLSQRLFVYVNNKFRNHQSFMNNGNSGNIDTAISLPEIEHGRGASINIKLTDGVWQKKLDSKVGVDTPECRWTGDPKVSLTVHLDLAALGIDQSYRVANNHILEKAPEPFNGNAAWANPPRGSYTLDSYQGPHRSFELYAQRVVIDKIVDIWPASKRDHSLKPPALTIEKVEHIGGNTYATQYDSENNLLSEPRFVERGTQRSQTSHAFVDIPSCWTVGEISVGGSKIRSQWTTNGHSSDTATLIFPISNQMRETDVVLNVMSGSYSGFRTGRKDPTGDLEEVGQYRFKRAAGSPHFILEIRCFDPKDPTVWGAPYSELKPPIKIMDASKQEFLIQTFSSNGAKLSEAVARQSQLAGIFEVEIQPTFNEPKDLEVKVLDRSVNTLRYRINKGTMVATAK